MIIGIGTDIIEIKRIENAIKKENFLSKYFTEKEKILELKSIAANFAAKEAFSKALGTGVRGFSLNEIEVLRDELGAPFIVLYGNAEKFVKAKGVKKVHVSVSHSKEYATAVVILE